MSVTAVLLCGGTGLDADVVTGPAVVIVDELCDSPSAGVAAMRKLGADRVVLGLCKGRSHSDVVAALQRAGAGPFAVETVIVDGLDRHDAARFLAAATAKIGALAPDERGKTVIARGGISRRALFSIAGAATQAPVAVLTEAACVGSKRCGLCADVCPDGAVDLSGRLPHIDTGRCSACGRCVPGCPHGALRLAGSATVQTEAQLEELLSGVPGIVFACGSAHAEAPQAWALVELPSLALVTPGWILQSRLRGVEVRLVPCAGTCCSGVSNVEALANHLLSLCDPPEGTEGPVLLREPLATADAVARLVPREEKVVIRDEAAPLGVLTLATEGCTLCGACGTACPTGALRLDENERETILRFEPDACVGCGRCAATCPESVLEAVRGIDFTRVGRGAVELVRVGVETCDTCGNRLPPPAMQRRLRELLPELAEAPLGLCAACAHRVGVTPAARV